MLVCSEPHYTGGINWCAGDRLPHGTVHVQDPGTCHSVTDWVPVMGRTLSQPYIDFSLNISVIIYHLYAI